MLSNTSTQFGSISKLLHWLMSIMIISLIIVGFIMVNMDKSALKFTIYDTHKLTGLFILLLIVPRLVWRLINTTPNLNFVPSWEKKAAQTGQWLLYGMMFAMPLSGWIMSTAAGYIPSIAGFAIAFPVEKNQDIASIAKTIHATSAWVFAALITMHIFAALKSHWIDKNFILKRMLPSFTQHTKKPIDLA